MNVVILGGTSRGRELAELLTHAGVGCLTSLAGRTTTRRSLPGRVRVGGFGGADGLAAFLADERPAALVDATHPFAAQMSWHAATACAAVGIPLLRLAAPSWRALPEAAAWTWVPDHAAAAAACAARPGRILLTVGRQELGSYAALAGRDVVARVIDAPDSAPPGWSVVAARGPYALAAERALLAGPPPVATLVSKDSGGATPDPKLVAAAEAGAGVVMVARPPQPVWEHEVATPAAALAWLRR